MRRDVLGLVLCLGTCYPASIEGENVSRIQTRNVPIPVVAKQRVGFNDKVKNVVDLKEIKQKRQDEIEEQFWDTARALEHSLKEINYPFLLEADARGYAILTRREGASLYIASCPDLEQMSSELPYQVLFYEYRYDEESEEWLQASKALFSTQTLPELTQSIALDAFAE